MFQVQAVRQRFPSLHRTIDGVQPIFFDNPAGTQVPQSVIDAVSAYFTNINANSGAKFATSIASDAMVQATREKLARFLNAQSVDEIVIGANMTTLNFALSRAIAQTLKPGDEIALTRMDHDANVSPWLRIADDYDLVVKWVDIVEPACQLDLNSLEAALTERTKIVATVHASNAVGSINPVAQIAQMAHAAGALYVVDAVQSAPHIPIDVQAIGCDFLLCSSYKFFGPHQGVLWGRYDLLASLPAYKVRPLEDVPPFRWETGTPAFELIAGIGAAVDYIHEQGGMAALIPYERELVTHLIEVIQAFDGAHISGITDSARYAERVPTVAFTHDRYTPSQLSQHLANEKIFVWDGNYYAVEIMRRLNKPQGMVRVGLAHYNTHEEIEKFAVALSKL
jgi:cysteine desulfurase family protein (TIGR01976 family)